MYRRSRLFALLAAAAAVLALGAGPSAAQPAPDPIPAEPPPGTEVVHSWALAPAADPADPSQAGSRSFFSYELEPGATIEDAVTLFNLGNVPLTFSLYATDAANNDVGDFELLPAADEPVDLGTWVETSTSLVTVPAQSQLHIPITIRVPSDATAGDHAGAVLAASDTRGTGPDGQEVVLDRRTGPRVYIRVAGEITPELSVEGVSTSYEPELNPLSGTATVRYRIRNTGNVRLGGTHHVSVAGPLGVGRRRSKTMEVPELLPGESIEVEAELGGVPALGLSQAEVVLEPSAESGAESAIAAVTASGSGLAPPVTLILGGVAVTCALVARRSYLRRQRLVSVGPAAP